MHRYELNNSDKSSTNKNIKRYVKRILEHVVDLDKAKIDFWTQEIVVRSRELFQWAATACKHVRGNGGIDHDPQGRTSEVLNQSTFNGLDGLYTAILDPLLSCE